MSQDEQATDPSAPSSGPSQDVSCDSFNWTWACSLKLYENKTQILLGDLKYFFGYLALGVGM